MQVKQPPTRAQRSAGFVARGERRALPLLICFVLLALPLVPVHPHRARLATQRFLDRALHDTECTSARGGSLSCRLVQAVWLLDPGYPPGHAPAGRTGFAFDLSSGDSSQPGNTRSSRLPAAFVFADFPAFLHSEHDGAVGHARHGVHAARPAALLAKGIRSSFGCVPRAGAGKGDRTGCALSLWGASGRKEGLEARQLLCPARRGAWPMVMAARSSNRLLAGKSRLRSL